jgi:hypothetical protein
MFIKLTLPYQIRPIYVRLEEIVTIEQSFKEINGYDGSNISLSNGIAFTVVEQVDYILNLANNGPFVSKLDKLVNDEIP